MMNLHTRGIGFTHDANWRTDKRFGYTRGSGRRDSRPHGRLVEFGSKKMFMKPLSRNICGATLSLIAIVLSMNMASAQQSGSGCALQPVGGTSRQLLRCQGGLTVVAEPGSRYTLVDRNRDGRVDGVRLQSKALLLDFAPGTGSGFQVTTPQAIAAVRGTKWAVDVGGGKTAVFVVRGQVAVQRPSRGNGVLLGPGEGVDVDAGTSALVVKRWPRPRVAALMARFGQ